MSYCFLWWRKSPETYCANSSCVVKAKIKDLAIISQKDIIETLKCVETFGTTWMTLTVLYVRWWRKSWTAVLMTTKTRKFSSDGCSWYICVYCTGVGLRHRQHWVRYSASVARWWPRCRRWSWRKMSKPSYNEIDEKLGIYNIKKWPRRKNATDTTH